jgi:aspartyl/asparaginyl beta-hydroxylase (cupin superfamily)
MAALNAVPLETIPDRSPFALFSKLRPGAWIEPHTGFMNTRLVCHLPLVVPEGCSFRVGNETRGWSVGELMVFDDTIEHEARNAGREDRVVMIFNIWRPELSSEERGLVSALIAGIGHFDDVQ